MTERLRSTMQAALQLCDWINESPHERGSINGLAAQVGYALRAALAEQEVNPASRVVDAAALILSDCGCSTNNEALLMRVAERISKLVCAEPVKQEPSKCCHQWMRLSAEPRASARCVDCGALKDVRPPRREWVSLTDEERQKIIDSTHPDNRWTLAERVEYRLKEKNT